jgi:hypothetical protein
MAPYNVPDSPPPLEPRRLVLVPLCCFYCGHSVEADVLEWRIFHLFGTFHCPAHKREAERDCRNYMRDNDIVRLCDARSHPILGAFLTALGNTIPVLRSSGDVDCTWHIPYLDQIPIIRRSKTTGAWGFNLTNGYADKFIPLSQFHDPRVTPHVKDEVRDMLEVVDALLSQGFYSS